MYDGPPMPSVSKHRLWTSGIRRYDINIPNIPHDAKNDGRAAARPPFTVSPLPVSPHQHMLLTRLGELNFLQDLTEAQAGTAGRREFFQRRELLRNSHLRWHQKEHPIGKPLHVHF